MQFFDRVIASISPEAALRRVQARRALDVMMRYDAAQAGNRAKSFKPRSSDADNATAQRERLSFIARDAVRNVPYARRMQEVIASNVVGDGIIPKVTAPARNVQGQLFELVTAHFDTTAIDANGRLNLYGLQRAALNCIVESGEVLIRRRRRTIADGLPLPFQIELLEPDYLDESRDRELAGGGWIREGIEYDAIGRRVAYWLFPDHPGSDRITPAGFQSRRVPASEILHVYRVDRPGQSRGVSWFAPILLQMQDMADYQEAQILRQKIAACFAAFRISSDDTSETDPGGLSSVIPGRIQNLAPGEDIKFAEPPGVTGYEEFLRTVLRSMAAGGGITYESLAGDLSNVNFSSARMGRNQMERNISAWQWLMMIPQMLQPLGDWTMEAAALVMGRNLARARLDWTPPTRILVDPTREIPAMGTKVRLGLTSRPAVIRELGFDPERVTAEIAADAKVLDAAGLVLDSDPRRTTGSGGTNAQPNNAPTTGAANE